MQTQSTTDVGVWVSDQVIACVDHQLTVQPINELAKYLTYILIDSLTDLLALWPRLPRCLVRW